MRPWLMGLVAGGVVLLYTVSVIGLAVQIGERRVYRRWRRRPWR